MRIQRIQNLQHGLADGHGQEQPGHAEQFSRRASMRQIIDAGLDNEWNEHAHQLGDQQAEKSRYITSFVAGQVRSEWTERTQH